MAWYPLLFRFGELVSPALSIDVRHSLLVPFVDSASWSFRLRGRLAFLSAWWLRLYLRLSTFFTSLSSVSRCSSFLLSRRPTPLLHFTSSLVVFVSPSNNHSSMALSNGHLSVFSLSSPFDCIGLPAWTHVLCPWAAFVVNSRFPTPSFFKAGVSGLASSSAVLCLLAVFSRRALFLTPHSFWGTEKSKSN